MAKPEGVGLTVEGKQSVLRKYCESTGCENRCKLVNECWIKNITPFSPDLSVENIEKMYRILTGDGMVSDKNIKKHFNIKSNEGEPIMNEHETQTTLEATIDGTIVIPRGEYAYLIAKSAKADLLEDYVNNRDYLDKDVVRAILGMYRSEESEG